MFSRFKIGPRLAVGSAMLLALAVFVGVFSLSRLAAVNANTKDLATNWLVSAQALGRFADSLYILKTTEIGLVLATSQEEADWQTKRAEVAKKALADAWASYAPTITPGEEQALADKIQQTRDQYLSAREKTLVEAAKGPDNREAAMAAYKGESRKAFIDLANTLQIDQDLQKRGADKAFQDALATYSNACLQVTGLLVAAIFIGAVLAWRTTLTITKPVMEAATLARRVANGDLGEVAISSSQDEMGQLLVTLSDMRRSLVDVVAQVRTSSDSIATGSGQIAAGNADLSQRTEEQASNLQQTAASMEQLTSTVRQNADNAGAATLLVNEASSAAQAGQDTVSSVVDTMGDIEAASRKVGEIIGVIDGIAFQTNILALNAAVEAARAGEHGRGFAVVASEVRALAARSAAAAKEVKTLVTTSTERVEAGVLQVSEAGQAIGNIAEKVSRVKALMNEIASASGEQSVGISQVGDAVSQLDRVTQQNAALVEESAAAAESLKHQADTLAETVSFFKI